MNPVLTTRSYCVISRLMNWRLSNEMCALERLFPPEFKF